MTDLTLELPSSIIYVAGYVNDIETVFYQDAFNPWRWRASVDAAEDSLYHIQLEMHDEAGNVGYYNNVIEYILPVFVYDRTQADVDRVHELRQTGWMNMTPAQKKEWLQGLKGCLNTADLKRIENAVYVIARMLNMPLQTNKDNLPELPDTLYFKQMLDNVAALRESGYIRGDTPELPAQPLNTYQKINDVEHILHDVYEIYLANNSRFVYCGESYAGDEFGLL